ncbi:hypothetical protein [Achromobacter xylosoxidans]|uniref:hypothetical protein n=1 Tax=Alcaligenes xylosoxydans xylosoxydans TaxID=85698 RepID=UPI0013F4DA26|nr:hypothetical protein [Achromobacter xylosoxidans]
MWGNNPDMAVSDAPSESSRMISIPAISRALIANPTKLAMPIADDIDRYTCGLDIAHVNKSTTAAPKADQTTISMPIPFPENSECESAQFKGKREGAHLVQNPTAFHIPAHTGLVLLAAQAAKDIHHSAFGRIFEGAQGDVLGLGQQGFGFSHFHLVGEVDG